MNPKSLLACLFLGLALVGGGCALKRSPHPRVTGLLQSINERELQGHAQALAAIGSRPENNAPKTDLTIRFIENTLQAAGYQVIAARPGTVGKEARNYNIIAEIKGARRPECVVELGVHYDTVPFSPGADDNGSGVAGALAIAQALSTARCAKTIRFVFYCNEETGGAGSRTHVRNLLANKEEQFEGAIVLETIGYAVDGPNTQRTPIRIPLLFWPPRTGNFIVDVGNTRSAFIGNRYERSARTYAPELKYYSLNRLGGFLKDGGRSDHAAYWESQLPALMLTDTANFRNPHYHQASDCIETLNFGFMSQVTRAAAATLLDWAEIEPKGVGAPHPTPQTGNALTCYREPCKRLNRSTAIDNPNIGLSTKGLSREAACRRMATHYWNAVMSGNEELVAKLWCAWPSGGYPRLPKENRVQQLIEVGKPYRQPGCFDGIPNLITPTRIQLTDGRIVEDKLIVIFRDLGMEESCLIIGTYNR